VLPCIVATINCKKERKKDMMITSSVLGHFNKH
jgi:hypothetical protein